MATDKRKGKAKKKKISLTSTSGLAHVQASFNNTIITISDSRGNVISWSSAGEVGFSGSRKSTAYAAQLAAEKAATKAKEVGLHDVRIHVSGPGAGRESAIRAIQAAGLDVTLIRDTTKIPHNGCRPRKRRRV